MKRNYETENNKTGVTMFVGSEIERTPAHGMTTLFVVGNDHTVDDIIDEANAHGCNHIYTGANMSFDVSEYTSIAEVDADIHQHWATLIRALLDADFWVTLDFQPAQAEWVLEEGLTEHRRFIPMISVRIPYVDQMGYNASIKIDDVDFDSTNDGVWVHSLRTLMDRSVFTNWDQYTSDHIIK